MTRADEPPGRATLHQDGPPEKWVVELGGAGHRGLVSFGYPPRVVLAGRGSHVGTGRFGQGGTNATLRA